MVLLEVCVLPCGGLLSWLTWFDLRSAGKLYLCIIFKICLVNSQSCLSFLFQCICLPLRHHSCPLCVAQLCPVWLLSAFCSYISFQRPISIRNTLMSSINVLLSCPIIPQETCGMYFQSSIVSPSYSVLHFQHECSEHSMCWLRNTYWMNDNCP